MLRTIEKIKNGGHALIVCLGDSITEQNSASNGFSNYAALLSEKLIEPYARLNIKKSAFVFNAGVGGDNTADMLKRLETDVLRFRPDLVTLMAGANDACRGPDGLENFRDNLRAIAGSVRAAGAEMLFITPPPFDFALRVPQLEGRRSYPEYIKAFRKAARDENIPLCDVYKLWEDDVASGKIAHLPLMNDALHPNERGHRYIAGILFSYLGI